LVSQACEISNQRQALLKSLDRPRRVIGTRREAVLGFSSDYRPAALIAQPTSGVFANGSQPTR